MKSIYLKNFMSTAISICMCIVLLALCCFAIGKTYLLERYKNHIVNVSDETAQLATAMSEIEDLDSWQLKMTLSAISGSSGIQTMVTNADGEVVNCSDRDLNCEHIGETLSQEVLNTSGEEARMAGQLQPALYGAGVYFAVRPVLDSSESVIGYVSASGSMNNMLGTYNKTLMIAVLAVVGVLLASLLVALAFTKRIAKPLDDMASAAREFALGDYSARVEQTGDPSDEVGSLVDAFNKMADAIENNEKRRSEFISNISHELRTPMTTISGFADGILDGTIPKEDERKYLISIRDETRRLARLVREMLDASRAKAGKTDLTKWEVFDISELTIQVLLSFEGRATEKGLDVDPQLPDNRMMVRADKDGITRVIYNLLDNAVKFANPDSCITVRVYKDNGKAYVSVKDEGETIPPDDLPLIFDRFHKSDRSRSLDKEGVGLGLYLVKSIINNHGEEIVARSENGVTEFVFTLPLAEQ